MEINYKKIVEQMLESGASVKITDSFNTNDECETCGPVYIHKVMNNDEISIRRNKYLVSCGGSYMSRHGCFKMEPIDCEFKNSENFYRNKLFKTFEDAWNTFFQYNS